MGKAANMGNVQAMHHKPGSTSLMVEGKSGTILSKSPFFYFADQEQELKEEKQQEKEEQEIKLKERTELGLKVKEVKENVSKKLRLKLKKLKLKVKLKKLELKLKKRNLVEFMERQILDLEEELECPVCLEVATTAPIYKCPEDHLICW